MRLKPAWKTALSLVPVSFPFVKTLSQPLYFFVLSQHAEQWVTPSLVSGVPPTFVEGEKKEKNSRKIKLNYKKKTKLCKRIAVFTELDLVFDTICIHLPE